MNKKPLEFYPVALTIAGSDSGGGAGIQADLRTFSAFGVYGCSVITAVTSQNPFKVGRVDPMSQEAVAAQFDAVKSAFRIGAVKTGMLFGESIINTIAPELEKLNVPLVVDPVMVATSGAKLLQDSAVKAMKDKLLPVAAWITPNLKEAELLLECRIGSLKDMADAAKRGAEKWNCGFIVKGGHLGERGSKVSDIVAYEGKVYQLTSPAAETTMAAHGTGCTFSAAAAAGLALKFPWKKALCAAKGFVFGSLEEAVQVGEELEAMYPPEDTYLGLTKLFPFKS